MLAAVAALLIAQGADAGAKPVVVKTDGGTVRARKRNKAEGAADAGPLVGSGGLPKEVIAEEVKRHYFELRVCYEQQQQDRAGKLTTHFVIGPDGKVVEAAIRDSDMPVAVNECIQRRVMEWKFPEPAGGGRVEVNFPWVFQPE